MITRLDFSNIDIFIFSSITMIVKLVVRLNILIYSQKNYSISTVYFALQEHHGFKA